MIIFIYGTTAEAIKLAPIARRLDQRNIPYEHWLALQHTTALRDALPKLGFQPPDAIIANGSRGEPLKSYRDVLRWLASIGSWMCRNIPPLRRSLPKNTVILIHGDTMTSVVGSVIARCLRVKSAHVEAGLRSGDWRNPFPEELDRRIVGRLASIHYTPSEVATTNLGTRKNIVYTHGNTVVDAVLDHQPSTDTKEESFGVVLLHRFELMSNQQMVDDTISTLANESPLLLKVLVDAYSKAGIEAAIRKHGKGRLIPQPKLGHDEFVNLLSSAKFVVTDSGGIQEETALMGVPTIVHRKTTERDEGLGANIVLSEWRTDLLANFLHNFESYRRPVSRPESSPSDIIVEDLVARGYAS